MSGYGRSDEKTGLANLGHLLGETPSSPTRGCVTLGTNVQASTSSTMNLVQSLFHPVAVLQRDSDSHVTWVSKACRAYQESW